MLQLSAAKQAYGSQRWLEASDLFELSLVKFRESLEDCYLLCEDVVHVNLTQPDMSPIKNALLREYGFQSDTMEYYEIQQLAVMEVCYTIPPPLPPPCYLCYEVG